MAKNVSSTEPVTIDARPFVMPGAILVSAFMLSFSLIISSVVISNGGGLASNVLGNATSSSSVSSAASSAPEAPTIATASIDDDAVLGDKKAGVYILEFSDYECPFCQKFKNDTLGEIKKAYIDTGKVAVVYRDLPLSFHEPSASYAANLAECTRKQGGDSAYYKFHDFWYENTATNGTGITDKNKIKTALNGMGVKADTVMACADNKEFANEIAKDASDANAAGISGTPGFIVGKIGADGKVTGDIISGAYPFATFQAAIEKYL